MKIWIIQILLATVVFVHAARSKDAFSDEKRFFPFNLLSESPTTEGYYYKPRPYKPVGAAEDYYYKPGQFKPAGAAEDYYYKPGQFKPAPYRQPPNQKPPMPHSAYNKPMRPNFNQPMKSPFRPLPDSAPPRYPSPPTPPPPMRPINILLNLPAVPAMAESYTTPKYQTTTAYPVAATPVATPSYTTTTTPSYATPVPYYPTTTPLYATPAPSYPAPGSSYPTPGPSYPAPPGFPSANMDGRPVNVGTLPNMGPPTLPDIFQNIIPPNLRP